MGNFLSTLLPTAWTSLLGEELDQEYFKQLEKFVAREYRIAQCYPHIENIFGALNFVNPLEVKCIVVGQDPYHGPGQANGLAFSVTKNAPLPPSLKNIFKEYSADTGFPSPLNGDLSPWVSEGVLLLNTVLTVREGNANSHAKQGWEIFTYRLMQRVLEVAPDVGFICFGKPAFELANKLISENPERNITVISTPHPSPLSAYRGFFGSKPFTRFNHQQAEKGKETVSWELPSSTQKTLF